MPPSWFQFWRRRKKKPGSRRTTRFRHLAAASSAKASSDLPKEKSFLTKSFLLAAGACVAVAVALLTGVLLRRFDYKQQIIVNDFLISAPAGAQLSGDLGKEVSDLFANDLNDIIQEGSSYSGSTYSSSGRSKIAPPFDGVPKVPVSKSYGIQIEGISIDQILSLWNSIRYDQQIISGDILPTSGKAGEYVLQISLRTDRAAYHWTSGRFSSSQGELTAMVRKVAETYIKDTNPEIAGCYFIANRDYPDAAETFAEWLSREPERAEPNLYLAKTFLYEGDYSGAQTFAQRALNSAPSVAKKNRRRLVLSAKQAKATALWGAGDPGAEQAFRDPDLSKQAYALNQLGTLYLDERKYQQAEATLLAAQQQTHGRNFGAAMVLGETYLAEKKYPQADPEFETALQIKPTSSDAAVGWLEAAHAVQNDAQAAVYCRAWIGTAARADAVISDKTRDLYLFCAQAEGGIKAPNAEALRWDYAETLTHPEGNATAEGGIFSNMLMVMPASLCDPGVNYSSLPSAGKAEMAEALDTLTVALKKRASVYPEAAGMAAKCVLVRKALASKS